MIRTLWYVQIGTLEFCGNQSDHTRELTVIYIVTSRNSTGLWYFGVIKVIN